MDRKATDTASPPAPADLLRAARGFSALFWGLIASFAGFAGFLKLPFGWLDRVPPHTPGVVLLLAGSLWLLRATGFPARWRDGVRILTISILTLACLLPILHWWDVIPHAGFLAFNTVLVAGALLTFAISAHRIGISTGHVLSDAVLVAEGRICAWLAAALLVVSIALSGVRAAWVLPHVGFGWDVILAAMAAIMRPTILLSTLLPMIPTMAMLWESKERCLARLARMD